VRRQDVESLGGSDGRDQTGQKELGIIIASPCRIYGTYAYIRQVCRATRIRVVVNEESSREDPKNGG
jgi:hypothetical protein